MVRETFPSPQPSASMRAYITPCSARGFLFPLENSPHLRTLCSGLRTSARALRASLILTRPLRPPWAGELTIGCFTELVGACKRRCCKHACSAARRITSGCPRESCCIFDLHAMERWVSCPSRLGPGLRHQPLTFSYCASSSPARPDSSAGSSTAASSSPRSLPESKLSARS